MRFTPPLLIAALAAAAHAQASFHPLGDFDGGAFDSDAWRVSDDGRNVVGGGALPTGSMAHRWTVTDALVRLGTLGAGFDESSFATGISASGHAVCGYATGAAGTEAFRWTADAGMIGLGDLPGAPHNSAANYISADGATVVGTGNRDYNASTLEAFWWTEATGIVGLGHLQTNHQWSEAWCASADGTIVGGLSMEPFVGGEAFVWTPQDGMIGLGDIPGNVDFSIALDMTPDGSVITGSCTPPAGYEAFRWTAQTGMVPLGDLPGGGHYSTGGGITDDGNTIVGQADWDGGFGGANAFIWDPANGMRNLKEVLENEHALDLTGWQLLSAWDISGDGRFITGQGINPDGNEEGWIVDLGGCPADFNNDGDLNTRDVLDFLNAWNAGC